ncbi:MAG: beta-ketoacyl synthase N-terminal-like domain-containing protein, partial [Chloroflexota bacterium]
MRDAVIVSAVRTAVGKSKRGGFSTVRPDELASSVITALLQRTAGLDPAAIEDVILGCAFPEGEQGLNMARTSALRAGLSYTVSGETINRYCSSGVQSVAHAAFAIMTGQLDIAIAGGAESMSLVPMTGNKFAPNA